jgi:hypothetical protein
MALVMGMALGLMAVVVPLAAVLLDSKPPGAAVTVVRQHG